MPKDNKQKIKLLYLMEVLRQETDEQHPMSTNQICKRLGEQGISCERRTVGMDMKVLNDYGYEIMSKMVGHEKAYYIDDRSFSVPEIKILMDAVQAAKFITPGKSAALIEKLAALGGSHQAEILKGNIVCFDTRKHTNEMIFYSVQALEDAIREHKKASFLYFDLNEKREKVYRRNGERYIVDPMSLVYNEDFQCIINTYLPRYKTNPGRVSPENNIDCPFGELGLVDVLNKRKKTYKKSIPSSGTINPYVALAVIVDNAGTRKEISLNELLTAPCNIGKVFNLDSITMLDVLYRIEKLGLIKINRTAGLDVIMIQEELSFFDCVGRFYASIDEHSQEKAK